VAADLLRPQSHLAQVVDPFLRFIELLSYQQLQAHQDAAIRRAEDSVRKNLLPRLVGKSSAGSSGAAGAASSGGAALRSKL
jgi:hypothetical protein